MRFLPLTIVMLAFFCAGCATPLKEVQADAEKATICCQSVSALPYEKTEQGLSLRFKIDSSSPAFLFREGKSYFKALTLPESSDGLSIAIYSYLNGVFSGSENDSHIFYPVLMFLDQEFKVLRVISKDLMRYQPPTWGEPARLEGRIAVPGFVGAKYLVIYTTKALLEERTTFSYAASTGVFMSGNIPVPVHNPGSIRRYPHSPIGDLKIEIHKVQGK